MSPRSIGYGAHPEQFGELSLPRGGASAGTVVIVHGGFWRARYGLALGRPLATDLVARGYTCWNIEYRRVGNGGGWPTTLRDVAAAIDRLAELDVDTTRVVAIGHSAGGHLAVWAAGRDKLPTGAPGADPAVRLTGVVSQAGVLDLGTAHRDGVGGTAVADLLGAGPDELPARYAVADPIRHLPVTAAVLCVHARTDDNVPFAQSTAYVAAARAAGTPAALQEVAGDHFTVIDPATPAWTLTRDALPQLLDGRLPG